MGIAFSNGGAIWNISLRLKKWFPPIRRDTRLGKEIAEENTVSSLLSGPCPAIPIPRVPSSTPIDWAEKPR